MTEDRRRQLQAMITWRTVTGTDLANCNIESGGGLNDDEIFPRNAVGQLFNHYYKINDESEIMAFAGLIESYMRRDEYYCLFYGKQFRKILTYLRRKGRTVRARSLLQGYLFSLGVLCDDEGETISVGSFTGGHDSHSFQVTFFAEFACACQVSGSLCYRGSVCEISKGVQFFIIWTFDYVRQQMCWLCVHSRRNSRFI